VALGLAALAAACSSSSNADGPVSGDGGPSGDAGPPTTLHATLDKASEAAAGNNCAGAASAPTGSVTVTISGDGSTVTISNLTYSGLSGTATMAHIHFGGTTTAGPNVLNMSMTEIDGTQPITKVFHASDYSPSGNAPSAFGDFVTAMKAGNSYFNIHTAACTGGEIRGQLTM
jgi:hypothetical protein